MISASEALRIGLVNDMDPLSELPAESEALAKKIMVNAPQAVRFCMQAVRRGLGIKAFLEKAHQASKGNSSEFRK